MPKSSSLSGHGRRFRAIFSVSPCVCAIVWNTLGSSLPPNSMPEHVMCTLLFLKVYATEHINCSITAWDEKNSEMVLEIRHFIVGCQMCKP